MSVLPRMWCPQCREWTVLIDTGRCLWCSGTLVPRRIASGRDIEGMLPACHRLAYLHRHKIRDTTITGVDDLAQVAMVGVLKAARSWDGEGEFFGWAWRKARHEIQHYLRDSVPGTRSVRHEPLRAVSLDAPHPVQPDATIADTIPVDDEPDHDARLVLAAALARLDAHERALVFVHVVGCLSQSEIAPALGIHQTRVSARVRGALARLARTPEVASLRTVPPSVNPCKPRTMPVDKEAA